MKVHLVLPILKVNNRTTPSAMIFSTLLGAEFFLDLMEVLDSEEYKDLLATMAFSCQTGSSPMVGGASTLCGKGAGQGMRRGGGRGGDGWMQYIGPLP